MTRHLLVTGGCGFIGSHFVRSVLAARPGWRVTNLDNLSYSGNLENLSDIESDPRYAFVLGDIRDGALVARLLTSCDDVVHLAAQSHVDRSIRDTRPFIDTNVLGTHVLLEAALATGRFRGNGGRFIHVSTDEVYGSLPLEPRSLLFTEDSPLAPNSPYAASKAASDLLVRACRHTFGLDAITTRCSNSFGPYQFPEKIIPLFVTNLIEGKKVPLYGDGTHIRDWLHVQDHCEALLAILERGRPGQVYNIGANNERSNLELTRAILKAMGHGEDRIEFVSDRPGHDRRYAIDATKLRTELGWRPRRSDWPAALEETVRWYIDHPRWWQRIKSGEHRSV